MVVGVLGEHFFAVLKIFLCRLPLHCEQKKDAVMMELRDSFLRILTDGRTSQTKQQ